MNVSFSTKEGLRFTNVDVNQVSFDFENKHIHFIPKEDNGFRSHIHGCDDYTVIEILRKAKISFDSIETFAVDIPYSDNFEKFVNQFNVNK